MHYVATYRYNILIIEQWIAWAQYRGVESLSTYGTTVLVERTLSWKGKTASKIARVEKSAELYITSSHLTPQFFFNLRFLPWPVSGGRGGWFNLEESFFYDGDNPSHPTPKKETFFSIPTSTRKSVTRSAILPWMSSLGMRKEVQETTTKSEEGR